MTQTDLENALLSWLSAACAPAPVIWDRQRANRPKVAFATLRLIGPSGPGGAAPDWSQSYDPAGWATGTEIVETTRHDHEYALRLTAYAPDAAAARSIALLAHDSASKQSTRDLLDASDIALVEVVPMQDVGALLDTGWEGRVVVGMRIRIADLVTERTNSIQTVGFDPASRIN